MPPLQMPEDVDHERRRFFSTAAISIAAAEFILSGAADAQPAEAKPKTLPAIKPGTNTSFAPPGRGWHSWGGICDRAADENRSRV